MTKTKEASAKTFLLSKQSEALFNRHTFPFWKKEKILLIQISKKNFSYIGEVDTLNLILFMIPEPTLDCNPGGERNLY